MKLKGEFESCSLPPEYIEIAYSDKPNALIKTEELVVNDNKFFDNEAYFLGDIPIPDTVYLFNNFEKIVDDFENDVFYKTLIAEDDTGKVIINSLENEETGEKKYNIEAEWYAGRDDEKENKSIEINSNTSRPNLSGCELISFKELDIYDKSINPEIYEGIDQIKRNLEKNMSR